MSSSDNDTKEIAENAGGETAVASLVDNGKKKEEKGSSGPIFLFFLVGVFASLIVGWVIFPKLLYSQKKQPIDFNHQLHMDRPDDGCQSCRFYRDDGSYAGVPTLAQCTDCHEA